MILHDAARIDEYTKAGFWGTTTLGDLFRRNVAATPDKARAGGSAEPRGVHLGRAEALDVRGGRRPTWTASPPRSGARA